MEQDIATRRFERLALPHLDAAYNLARWMLRDEHDAEDVVQDSYLRALRSFAGFRGDAMRPWLLAIVRNSALTWLERRSVETHFAEFDEDVHGGAALGHGSMNDPLQALTHNEDRKRVNAALMRLPVVYREVLILREIEELAYRDIATVVAVPIGTVMSRLARARSRMLELMGEGQDEPHGT